MVGIARLDRLREILEDHVAQCLALTGEAPKPPLRQRRVEFFRITDIVDGDLSLLVPNLDVAIPEPLLPPATAVLVQQCRALQRHRDLRCALVLQPFGRIEPARPSCGEHGLLPQRLLLSHQ